MTVRAFPITFLLTASLGIQTREVNHHLAWGVDLAEAGPVIDAYRNDGFVRQAENVRKGWLAGMRVASIGKI